MLARLWFGLFTTLLAGKNNSIGANMVLKSSVQEPEPFYGINSSLAGIFLGRIRDG